MITMDVQKKDVLILHKIFKDLNNEENSKIEYDG